MAHFTSHSLKNILQPFVRSSKTFSFLFGEVFDNNSLTNLIIGTVHFSVLRAKREVTAGYPYDITVQATWTF
jgi:hypothetical protein